MTANINIATSSVLSAFDPATVGSKVIDRAAFMAAIEEAVAKYDFASARVPGQGFLPLPSEACVLVSAGVGRRTDNPDDYVVRMNRGRAAVYLRRENAAEVESLACVVYTREAYLADPDVRKDIVESARIADSETTHVVVAVLASAGPKAPYTPDRFVKNLAGGNKEALVWSADEIRAKAKEVADYDSEWIVVAD